MIEQTNLDKTRAATDAVWNALRTHLSVLETDSSNVAAIVSAGSALRDAVLAYEQELRAATGWSNPIRHLGRLPSYLAADTAGDVADRGTGARVRVRAEYLVQIEDEDGLYNLVEGRGGDRPNGLAAAVQYLIECDGWEAGQYPPTRVRPLSAVTDVTELQDGP